MYTAYCSIHPVGSPGRRVNCYWVVPSGHGPICLTRFRLSLGALPPERVSKFNVEIRVF